jgi:hypothetical protein
MSLYKFSSTGKIIFAILLFLWFAPSHTFSQIRIIVRDEVPNDVSFYEVEIKQAEDEDPQKIPREPWEPTGEISLNISLLPGSYQGRIIFYNSENQYRGRTEWKPFEVPSDQPIKVTLIIRPTRDSPFTFFIWPSWATSIPLYGELNQYFGFKIFPSGLRLGFDMIPSEHDQDGHGGFLGGMELAASWFYLNNFFDEHNITVHMIMLDFNILIQKQFSNQRVTFSFRIGMGLTILADRESTVDLNPLTAQINTGVSFLWLIKDSSYIETGIDFSHMFGWDVGGLRPWIGFGIRF